MVNKTPKKVNGFSFFVLHFLLIVLIHMAAGHISYRTVYHPQDITVRRNDIISHFPTLMGIFDHEE